MATSIDRLADAAAPLDVLLVDAARGPLKRLMPDSSALRWSLTLAQRPRITAGRLRDLGSETGRILLGTSQVAPTRSDRRFKDAAWGDNPFLKRLLQLYLASGETAQTMLTDAPLSVRDRQRLAFLLDNLTAAASPTNVPLLNPTSAKEAIDSGGLSLLRGAKSLVADLASSPRIPSMVDTSDFRLGETIAATEGAVVLRTELFELIQYKPQAEHVFEVPMLLLPPTINKFYAIDMAPGRSLMEHSVKAGRQEFVISWRNPDARHSDWDFDTYVQGIIEAMDVVQEITGCDRTMLGGICSGGILASITAAYLASTGRRDRVAGLCLAVTVIDNANAGTVPSMVNRRMASAAKALSQRRGYLDGRALAEVFAWLRPDDLIWNYWVNNYLLGKKPPAFDILFWNADTTRMAAGLHADFVDLAIENKLVYPGLLKVLGVPIDLGAITCDAYVVAGIADHITPWENCYRTTGLLGGKTRFVLSTSGHIAALVNPPGNPKASFHTNDDTPPDAREWLKGAETHQGSWWPDIADWLAARCGEKLPPPSELGSASHPPLAPAPGTYVFDK